MSDIFSSMKSPASKKYVGYKPRPQIMSDIFSGRRSPTPRKICRTYFLGPTAEKNMSETISELKLCRTYFLQRWANCWRCTYDHFHAWRFCLARNHPLRKICRTYFLVPTAEKNMSDIISELKNLSDVFFGPVERAPSDLSPRQIQGPNCLGDSFRATTKSKLGPLRKYVRYKLGPP